MRLTLEQIEVPCIADDVVRFSNSSVQLTLFLLQHRPSAIEIGALGKSEKGLPHLMLVASEPSLEEPHDDLSLRVYFLVDDLVDVCQLGFESNLSILDVVEIGSIWSPGAVVAASAAVEVGMPASIGVSGTFELVEERDRLEFLRKVAFFLIQLDAAAAVVGEALEAHGRREVFEVFVWLCQGTSDGIELSRSFQS